MAEFNCSSLCTNIVCFAICASLITIYALNLDVYTTIGRETLTTPCIPIKKIELPKTSITPRCKYLISYLNGREEYDFIDHNSCPFNVNQTYTCIFYLKKKVIIIKKKMSWSHYQNLIQHPLQFYTLS
jgi:hypothetical protein